MMRETAQLNLLRTDERSGRSLAALNEISKTISASLDLEVTVNNILQTVSRIMDYHLGEVNLWDAEAGVLRPRARAGDRSYTISIDRDTPSHRIDQGYSGWIARNKKPLLISDVEQSPELLPEPGTEDFPFQSIIGAPLLYGLDQELVGTLELASYDVNTYTEQDISLLELLAGPAAIAIRNAQRYTQQETRVAELSGLAQVAQTGLALGDPRELFATLTARIAKLMNVQLCGFLLYDESQQALVSQPPFHGSVPEAFLELYRIPLTPDSHAARLWRDEDHWYSNNVFDDPMVAEIGLKEIAESVGVRATLLVPLIVGGNRLGIVQVSNKLSNTPFTEDDARLLRIFAGQAAVLIDNARLVREAEERLKRAEVLRNISEIAGSARSLEEIYREVMARTAQLLRADMGIVLLLDEAKGEFLPQPGSQFGGDVAEAEFARLKVDDPSFRFSVAVTRRPFYSRRASHDRRIPDIYQRTLRHFGVESVIAVPLTVQDHSIGEVLLGARREYQFTRADLDLAATIAAQLASAIERERLASATDDTLRRRIDQLTSLTRVGRELNQTLELERILQSVYNEAIRATSADCGSIVLLDIEAAPLKARMRLGQHTETTGLNLLEVEAASSGASRIVPDLLAPDALGNVHADPAVAAAPVAHEGVRSILIMPVIYQGYTVGVIELHSRKVNGFDQAMLDFSQALAAQAAIAVGNAQRYQEQLQRGELLRLRADQLSQLLQISRTVRSDKPLAENLESIAFGLQEAVGYNVVLISVLDPDTNLAQRIAAAGVPIATFERLKNNPAPWPIYEVAFQTEFRVSQSYYIPHDRTPPELQNVESGLVPRNVPATKPGEWHQDDFLFVPLIGSGGQSLGIMSLDDPRNGRAPDRLTIETVEIFANQAALAIENARLYDEAEHRAAELSNGLAELQKSYRDLDAVSRALTRKEIELSNLIEQTEQRAKRLLALHRIASEAAEAKTEIAFLQRVTEATVREMALDVCLIALLRNGNGLQVVTQAGNIHPQNDLNALLGWLNPLSQIVELNTPLLARDLGQRGWGESKFIQALELRSFIALPIFISGRLIGVGLVGSQSTQSPFTNEDIDLFTILANQIGVGVENIRLDAETNEQLAKNTRLVAETQELQAFSASVFESLQQGLVVLNTQGKVLSLNGWMRQTFGWTDGLIGQNLFDFRSIYRDLGLADAVQRAVTAGQPIDRIVIRDAASDGSSIVSNFYGYPLRREGQVTGVVLLVEDVTAQARLEADVRERATQLQALTEVSRVISSTLRQEDVITLVLEQVGRVIPYDSATLWIHEEDFLIVAGARGFENNTEQIGLMVQVEDSRLFKDLSEAQQTIIVPDVRRDDRFPAGIISRTRSWLGTPLISKGQVLGLLALDKVEVGFYSANHAVLSMAFANQAAVALDNARLFEESVKRALELNDRSQRLALLNRISTSLNTTLDFDRILEIAVREMSKALEISRVGAIIYDEGAGVGNVLAEFPVNRSAQTAIVTIPLANNPLVDRLRETLAPVMIDDVLHTELLAEQARQMLLQRRVKSALIVPLIAGGQLLGSLTVDQGERGRFQPGEIELAQTIANQTAVAIQNARLYDETQLRLSELSAINQVSRVITAATDLNELFASLPEQLGAMLNTQNLYLALYDPTRNLLTFPMFYDDGKLAEVTPHEPVGVSNYIIQTRQSLLLTGDIGVKLEELGAIHTGDSRARSYLGVPMLAGDRVIGVLAVQDLKYENAFNAGHERILSTIASQLAVAIEKIRLLSETRQRSAELSALYDLGVTALQELDLHRLTNYLFDNVQRLLQVDSVSLTMLTDSDEMTVEMVERGERRGPSLLARTGNTFSEYVLNTQQPLMIGDLERDSTAVAIGYSTEAKYRAWLGVPLIVRGAATGVLSVQSEQPYYFTESQLRLLSQVGNQMAIALDNARLFSTVQTYALDLERRVAERTTDLEKERDRVETLLRITNELSANLDLDRVLTRALSLVNEVIGGTQGGLFLLDPQSDQLVYRAALGVNFQLPPGGQVAPFRRGEGLAGWVIKNRQAIIVPDLDEDERWIKRPQTPDHRSAICVPLISSEDALGAMIFYSNERNAFSDDQLRLVAAAANQVTSAINNAELYRLIRDQAERLGGMLRANQVEASKSRAILESVGDGVMVTDPDGRIILFNATAERILKLTREDVLSRVVGDFMGLYGSGARKLAEAINHWSNDPSSYQPGDAIAERIELDDKRIVAILLSPVTSTDEYLGSVSIFRDITREVEVDRLKTEFVTTVSHELRTPMTAIKGYADLLLMGAVGPVNKDQGRALEVIKSNADRLRILVDDLLDVSKIESGKVEFKLTPVSIADVIRDAANHVQGRITAQNRPMTVITNIPPDLPPVLADRERLAQIVTNLADNAFTYTNPGGTLVMSAHCDANSVQVSVKDNGIGMTEEELGRIFERFYRGEDPLVLASAGTGLGLNIVQRLVEMHGGHIWAESEGPGKGSTFHLRLKLAPEKLEIAS
ncbi:MAG: GAF domain-containing protein [Chloroflexi bacterium]|nr:GAF domain-containing protein [Chloroflexota bacterium]